MKSLFIASCLVVASLSASTGFAYDCNPEHNGDCPMTIAGPPAWLASLSNAMKQIPGYSENKGSCGPEREISCGPVKAGRVPKWVADLNAYFIDELGAEPTSPFNNSDAQ
jgi:hypothetical protein